MENETATEDDRKFNLRGRKPKPKSNDKNDKNETESDTNYFGPDTPPPNLLDLELDLD